MCVCVTAMRAITNQHVSSVSICELLTAFFGGVLVYLLKSFYQRRAWPVWGESEPRSRRPLTQSQADHESYSCQSVPLYSLAYLSPSWSLLALALLIMRLTMIDDELCLSVLFSLV